MPLTKERADHIFELVQVGLYSDITPTTIEKTVLREGDLCICTLYGVDSKGFGQKTSDLDMGAMFKSTEIQFDVIIHAINDKGWPTYISLLKQKDMNGIVTTFEPSPCCSVSAWLDIAEMNIDGIKAPYAAFLTILPDGRSELGISGGVLVLTRCIRAVDNINKPEKEKE